MEHKGNSWHETCFTCQRCQQPIGTKSFIPKDNSNFCVPCYEKQFAMQCVHCKKVPSTPPPTETRRFYTWVAQRSVLPPFSSAYHHRRGDIPRPAVAQGLLPLHQLQAAADRPEVHLQRRLRLLSQLLLQPLCQEMCFMYHPHQW